MLKVQTLRQTTHTMLIRRLFLFILLPTFLMSLTSSDKVKTLKIGKKMPCSTIEMMGTDGTTHTLRSLSKEKGLVVVFSCNTCPFVVGSTTFAGWEKDYNVLSQKANNAGLGFVLINSNETKRPGDDSMEAMITRSKDQDYLMPYLLDIDSKVADAFGAKTTPHVFVFDSSEQLIYRGSIDNTWDNQRSGDIFYLDNLLSSITGHTEIQDKDTPPRGCSIKRKQAN